MTTLLEAYLGQQQANQRESAGNLDQAAKLSTLQEHFAEQGRQQQARAEIAQLGPSPKEEDVMRVVAKYSAPKDVLQHFSTVAARRESSEARRYAADAAAAARETAATTAAEAKRAAMKPTTRSRISGETVIQEEVGADGTVKEIGRGPRFARSIAPAININAPSKEALSTEAVRDLAIQSLYDPNATSGYRRDTTAMSRIANERQKVMKEAGVTSEDVVSGRAGFKADTASLNKITPQYDAITAFEKTAVRNGKILKDLGDKVDTTGVPVIERWIRSGRKAIGGDEDVAKFHAQMNLYRAEAARILTQPNLSGVLTDTARKEMEHVLQDDATASQVRGVVDLLERDFHNRRETLEEQIGSIRARMRGRVAPGGPSTPGAAPAGPVPAGPAPAAAPTKAIKDMTNAELMEYRRRLSGGGK